MYSSRGYHSHLLPFERMTFFDRRSFFQDHCGKKMEDLEDKCKKLGIPYYWTACTANLPDGIVYEQGMYLAGHETLPGKLAIHKSIGLGYTIETHPDITQMPQTSTKKKVHETDAKSIYDKSNSFSSFCLSLLQEIVDSCTIGRIPFFFSAMIKSYTDGRMEYICNGLVTDGSAILLPDDRVNRHLLVCMGFSTKPPKNIIQTSFGDGIIVRDGDIIDDEVDMEDEDPDAIPYIANAMPISPG